MLFYLFCKFTQIPQPTTTIGAFLFTSIQKRSMRPRILGIIETWHLEKPCRMNTENIAPCFCIQSSTHRALRLGRIQNIKKLYTNNSSERLIFSIGLRWNFPDFGFAERSQKTLLYVGHSSLASYDGAKIAINERNIKLALIFLCECRYLLDLS